MMKRRLIAPLLMLLATLPFSGVAAAQSATWVRGYPQLAENGCVEYVAQWSDGTYTWVPWDCPPGVTAEMGDLTASRGYPQMAENGCVEYVTQWSDGSYTWVPFECPPGVTYAKPGSPPPAPGNTITAQAGQEFTITLAANRTTGYSWQLANPPDSSVAQLVGSTYEAPTSGLIGAGGQEVWTFRAVGSGTTTLTLEYRQPWEMDVSAAQTETYTIVVQ